MSRRPWADGARMGGGGSTEREARGKRGSANERQVITRDPKKHTSQRCTSRREVWMDEMGRGHSISRRVGCVVWSG